MKKLTVVFAMLFSIGMLVPVSASADGLGDAILYGLAAHNFGKGSGKTALTALGAWYGFTKSDHHPCGSGCDYRLRYRSPHVSIHGSGRLGDCDRRCDRYDRYWYLRRDYGYDYDRGYYRHPRRHHRCNCDRSPRAVVVEPGRLYYYDPTTGSFYPASRLPVPAQARSGFGPNQQLSPQEQAYIDQMRTRGAAEHRSNMVQFYANQGYACAVQGFC